MTSAYMFDGEDLSAKNKVQTLQNLADSIMNNMTKNHYLTYFYEADMPVKYALAENGRLEQEKIKATLQFYQLPLAKLLMSCHYLWMPKEIMRLESYSHKLSPLIVLISNASI